MTARRLPDDYFERVYADEADPWGFDSRWYERRKYDLTLAALPNQRYRSAVEPGCANGVLTARLAERCDRVWASDVLDDVVGRARQRVNGHAHVEVHNAALPDGWPSHLCDLAVLSEVAYYLSADGLGDLLNRVAATLEPDGHLVAVHWRGQTDYPMGGDEVHQVLHARPELEPLSSYAETAFRLDVFRRR